MPIPEMKLLSLLFQGIPETMALTAFALAFANRKLNWRIIVIIGIIQGITSLLVRQLPISFGIHTIILIIILALFLKLATKLPFLITLKTSAMAMFTVVIMEILFTYLLPMALNISLEEAISNTVLWIALGWPQIIALMLMAWLKDRQRKKGEQIFA